MDNNKELKRSLTLFPCVMIMITSVIGSGIFTVPNEIMLAAQGSGTIFLAWILAGLCVFLMAMVYMELGPAMPQAGGGYIYLREAFGQKFAYFYGWGKMVNEVSVIALYAMAITNYIGYFFQLSPVICKIVGTVIIVCAALFNIFGVKSGSGITSGLTVAKLLGLSVVIVGGLFLLKGSQSFEPVVSESVGWGGAIAAAVPAFFAFGGYNQLCYMSEEIKDPHKNLPRAIIIGLVSIVTVYILLTYVCIKALGVTGLAESTKAVASAASVIFGNVGGAIIAVCAIARQLRRAARHVRVYRAYHGCFCRRFSCRSAQEETRPAAQLQDEGLPLHACYCDHPLHRVCRSGRAEENASLRDPLRYRRAGVLHHAARQQAPRIQGKPERLIFLLSDTSHISGYKRKPRIRIDPNARFPRVAPQSIRKTPRTSELHPIS